MDGAAIGTTESLTVNLEEGAGAGLDGLSPETYLGTPPGALKNDTTIVE
jgi:hypothetical protein